MSVKPFALLLIGSLVAACGSSPGPSPTAATPTASPNASPGSSPAAVRLLLRVTSEGGFIGPAANLASVPFVSVYSDGRILTPGAVDAVYPGPLLLPVEVKNVGPAGAEAIVAAIRAAGLDRPSSTEGGGNPDQGTTVLAVNLDGTTITTRIGLGGGPGRPGGGGSPDPRAGLVTELLSRLQDQAEGWGAASPARSILVPTAYRLYVAPGAPAGDGSSGAPAVAWPFATPLDRFGVPAVPDRGIAGLRQAAVFGADAAALGPVLAAANALTAFSSAGKVYTLYVRPLVPDEVPPPG